LVNAKNLQNRQSFRFRIIINFAKKNELDVTEFEVAEEIKTENTTGEDEVRDLMVYNDDFNTFDHVIETLVKVCKHDVHQAEQCTYLIHYKGKCSVKKGYYDYLKPMREGITDAGIKAAIV
jgi:ATP-dependent Clp protease adaptor protein ClpS